MNEVVYLEADDEITSVVDRLKSSDKERVILVIPRGSALAQSIINLKILVRNARDLGKEILLVSTDKIATNLASQLGLTAYAKVKEAEAAPVMKKIEIKKPEIAPVLEAEPITSVDPESGIRVNSYTRYKEADEDEDDDRPTEPLATAEDEQMPVSEDEPESDLASKGTEEDSQPADVVPDESNLSPEPKDEEKQENLSERPKPQKEEIKIKAPAPVAAQKVNLGNRRLKMKKVLVSTVALLAVALVLSFLLIPYTTVAMQLKTEPFDQKAEIIVDKNTEASNVGNLTVPGKMFEVEKEVTKEFSSTGKKDNGEKARGKMAILNSYDTLSHKYPKGTKFISNGKTFLADEEFTVAGATAGLIGGKFTLTPGEGSAAVTADQPGESYNLAATTYVISGAPGLITGKGEAMAGGVTKEVSVVLEQDLNSADTTIQSDTVAATKADLIAQAKDGGYILPDSAIGSEVISVSHSKNVDDEADKFDTTMKVKVWGIGFLDKDLRAMMVEMANTKISSDKMFVNVDGTTIDYELASPDPKSATLKLTSTFKGRVGAKLSESDIANQIKNKQSSEAKRILEDNAAVEKAEISFWPKFLNRTPLLTNRIRVKFDYNK